MLTDLYLIRHGDPDRTTSVAYNVPPGPDLSARGRQEAAQAAAFLRERGLERLFVSPFARTAQTAEVIVDALDLPVTFTALIQEHGPQESFEKVRERIRELLAAAADSPHTRVGVVAHGSPIRAALLELSKDKIDLSRHVYAGGNPAPTCGIWHVQLLDEHTRRFELVFKPVEGVGA
jgi:2,3-bisphosphoglycerate-dependent phosphoglycerate mutase